MSPATPAASTQGSARPSRPLPRGRTRLIATDLDGTLLHSDKSVSSRTVAALAAAEEAGIDVFFVTGRPARWMDVVSEHVHGHGLAICANGAAVVDLHRGGRIVDVRPLEREDALAVVRELRRAAPGVSFAVERSEGIHYEPEYPPFQSDPGAVVAKAEKLLAEPDPPASTGDGREPCFREPDGREPDGRETGGQRAGGGQVTGGRRAGGQEPGLRDMAGQPVLKLLAFHPDLDPDAFLVLGREVAGGYAQFTRSSPSALLEISGRGVGKASMLARCCERRGIAPHEVVAFGDMPNDLEMLSWAGTSYAMANAHPEVLASTTFRTSANDEDGVAEVIEELLARCPSHEQDPRGRRHRQG